MKPPQTKTWENTREISHTINIRFKSVLTTFCVFYNVQNTLPEMGEGDSAVLK